MAELGTVKMEVEVVTTVDQKSYRKARKQLEALENPYRNRDLVLGFMIGFLVSGVLDLIIMGVYYG